MPDPSPMFWDLIPTHPTSSSPVSPTQGNDNTNHYSQNNASTIQDVCVCVCGFFGWGGTQSSKGLDTHAPSLIPALF